MGQRPESAVADPRATLRPGDLFAGRYRVEALLGLGGMGAVYRALDGGQPRALKVLRADLVGDSELQRRFVREAKAARAVASDHVADVFDAGVDEATGVPFVVLELLEGRELGEMLRERGRLLPEEVVLLLRQLAAALDRAHAIGVVHRDLKPSNLHLSAWRRDDGVPHLTVIDFGVAKLIEATLTGPQTEGLVGTPVYMAPEQVDAESDVGPATDIYAMGHIAYALLVGEPYFAEKEGGVGVLRLLSAIMDGPAEAASERARRRRGVALAPGFDAWFARASAVDPADRFATAGDGVAALARSLDLPPSIVAASPAPSGAVAPDPSASVRFEDDDEPVPPPPGDGSGVRLVVTLVVVLVVAVGVYWLTAALT